MTHASLTQDGLKQFLCYDQNTGDFTWKISRGSVKAGSKAGTLNPDGYVQIKFFGKFHKAHRLAWLYAHGEFPESLIDHINGVRHDNRISNLRQATQKQNAENRGKGRNNKSGFKGVHWHGKAKKWRARIQHDGKHIHLGFFTDANLAHEAYKVAEKQFFTHGTAQ